VVRAREHRTAGNVGLRGGDVAAESGGVGERPGARITGQEHAALHVDACRYPRRVRTNLDHDLTLVSQSQPDDGGQGDI
jgi:hypothetical protein